jgi:hypothetical protein
MYAQMNKAELYNILRDITAENSLYSSCDEPWEVLSHENDFGIILWQL